MSGHEIPRHWRLRQQRYSLVGEVCPHCDHKIFPPRDVCPNCGDEAKEKFTLPASRPIPPEQNLDVEVRTSVVAEAV